MGTWREGGVERRDREVGKSREERTKERERGGGEQPPLQSGTAGCCQATVGQSIPGCCQVAVGWSLDRIPTDSIVGEGFSLSQWGGRGSS